MKKVILAITLCLAMGGVAQAAGRNIISRGVNDITVHDYIVSSGNASQVIEGPENIVVLDVPANAEDNAEFAYFVKSLKKNVAAVVISHAHDHHWLGVAEMFPGAPIYSPESLAIAESAEESLEKAKKDMGELTAPAAKQLDNGPVTLGGVKFDITALPELGAVIIAMPDQRIAVIHHLGYVGVHVPLPPFDARQAELEKLAKAGYSWFVGGHGQPGGPEFVQRVKEYTDFVAKTVAVYPTAEEAKTVIVGKFPHYGGQALLDVLLPLSMPQPEASPKK